MVLSHWLALCDAFEGLIFHKNCAVKIRQLLLFYYIEYGVIELRSSMNSEITRFSKCPQVTISPPDTYPLLYKYTAEISLLSIFFFSQFYLFYYIWLTYLKHYIFAVSFVEPIILFYLV